MLIYIFNASNQRLRRYTSGVVFAGSYNKTFFQFKFNTPDWDLATIKEAVFSYRGTNYTVPLDENNMCKVPEEVLCAGAFQVSLQSDYLITNMVRVPVSEEPKKSDDSLDVKNGIVFIPQVSEDKILTWTNNGGLNNPEPVDLNVKWIDADEEEEDV